MNLKIPVVGNLCAFFFIAGINAQPMVPNPLISRGKPTYGSSKGTAVLVDGKFHTPAWPVTDGAWVAIKVGAGPSRVFFSWNNPAYSWSDSIGKATSCKNNAALPRDYDILISSNSTRGSDGRWIKVDSIRANTVTARWHMINFAGASRVKMSIITGGGKLDEIEIVDLSKGAQDLWFFTGTSITANTYKEGPVPARNFADLE